MTVHNFDEMFAGRYETSGAGENQSVAIPDHAELRAEVRNVFGETVTASFGFGGWGADQRNRKVFNGPMVAGPHAYAFQAATVISLHHIPVEQVTVAEGDQVVFLGHTFTVSVERDQLKFAA